MIFNKALGLPTNILGSVRMSYHKHPTIQFLLKKDIDITTLQEKFIVERKYHSGGELMTDTIHCEIVGMPKSQEKINKPYTKPTSNGKKGNETRKNQNNHYHQPNQPIEEIQIVKINGIESNSDIEKVKKWLALYGELLSEIKEESYHDNDPEAVHVGNGVFSVKMKIRKEIPNFLPALGLKIRINYKGCNLLCPNCYRVHPRGYCKNAKLTWIGYVHRFMQNNPTIAPEAYGRWWQITKREYPDKSPSANCETIPTKNKTDSERRIISKLREIRKSTEANPNVTSTSAKLKETIEKSVEQLILRGLSITEAVEYEANQMRLKQLQEKMTNKSTLNQYKTSKSQNHA